MSRIGAIKTDRGFTLIELLVVICIAGLVSAALVVPLGSSLSRSKFQSVVSEVEVELLHTAEAARRTGRDRAVFLRRSEAGTDLVFGQRMIQVAAPTTVEWVSAAELGTSNDLGSILFFGGGGASGGTLKISQGGAKQLIAVDWLTARVSFTEGQE